MEIQKPKIAFTADAFVYALQIYRESLFKLVPVYGKLFVSELDLCRNPTIMETHLNELWLQPLLRHWLDIISPPYFEETDEIVMLARLNELYADNVIIVVDKLEDYARLSRIYGDDQLYTVNNIKGLIDKI